MTNYRSLTGGFFSSNPTDKSVPVSIRCNNPGALNVAGWIKSQPGYVTDSVTSDSSGKGGGVNSTVVFESPEEGVAAWYVLMKKYDDAGADTVKEIITRYGGGQDYSSYYKQVQNWTGLSESQEIKLVGDDPTLLKFAKAMFRYEAGKELPWSDTQVLFGFNLARGTAPQPQPAPAPIPSPPPSPPPAPLPAPTPTPSQPLPWWVKLLYWLFGGPPVRPKPPQPPVTRRILKNGMVGDDVKAVQIRLIHIGYTDLVADGEFGDITEICVRAFQVANNIDPDGEVGELTWDALYSINANVPSPPLNPPSPIKYGEPPTWYKEAEKWIGFKEVGDNRGIEKFIAGAKTGSLGDPWCAIFVNYDLETVGVTGSRSAMARSFETNSNFVKLSGPALGAITPMWRGSPSSGQGHVFFYDGENSKGVRGIGGNESDCVKRSFHERGRITGYYWPKSQPLPQVKAIVVTDAGTADTGSET